MNDSSAPGDSLSKRGLYTFKKYDYFGENLNFCLSNKYDPETNPKGIVNLGSSEDKLMESEIEQRLNAKDIFKFKSRDHQFYIDYSGKPTLKSTLASFFNKYFNVAESISPENLFVMSGTSTSMEALCFALFDPDDVYITPSPTYTHIFTYISTRWHSQPSLLELPEEPDDDGKTYALTPRLLEDKIELLKSEGKRVKGFLLINPQNPLGDVYSPQLVRSLLQVCAKHKMHVILNQVYTLTLLDPTAEVTSLFSIPDIPDPQRTHFIWAMSKDFGLSGFRVSVIHTKNEHLSKVLKNIAVYSAPGSILQDAATTLLNDTKWLEELYFPLRRQRLHDRYQMVKSRLEGMGVSVRPSMAGLFIWADLGKFLRAPTAKAEIDLSKKIFSAGLYILPGSLLECKTPGWFRIIFTSREKDMQRGLHVLKNVLLGDEDKYWSKSGNCLKRKIQ